MPKASATIYAIMDIADFSSFCFILSKKCKGTVCWIQWIVWFFWHILLFERRIGTKWHVCNLFQPLVFEDILHIYLQWLFHQATCPDTLNFGALCFSRSFCAWLPPHISWFEVAICCKKLAKDLNLWNNHFNFVIRSQIAGYLTNFWKKLANVSECLAGLPARLRV